MRPLRPIILVLALLAGPVLALLGESALAQKPVTIGVVYNLTGAQASLDGPGLEGMKLALERINREGGALGRPVALEVRDGGSNLERCRAAAAELAGLGVTAMAGLNDSDLALAAAGAAVSAKVPFVTAGATLPTLPRTLGQYFFMACFSDEAQAKAMATFMLKKASAGSALVLTNRDHAFTTALAGYFTRAFRARGGEIPARVGFSAKDPDVFVGKPPACLSGGGCRGVFVAGQPEDAVVTVKALRKAGFKGPVFSGDGFDTPLLAELGDMASPGVFFATHAAYDSPRPEVRRFVEDWTRRHGRPPESGFAALGHDALGLIVDAIRRAGSDDPSRVRKALAATRGFEGVSGEISFPEALSPPEKTVFIVRFEGGRRFLEGEIVP